MSLTKRGNIWWYRFRFRGKDIFESSKSSNKDVCRRLEAERRRRLELGQAGLSDVAKPKKFAAAINDYLQDREAHWAPKTCSMHAGSMKHLEPFFSKLYLNEVTAEHIGRYQTHRKKEKASGRTINIEVALVRLVMRRHKLWANVADDVKMLKENKDIGRELSDDEMHRILTAAKASASRSLYPAILVSMHTALRNKELRMLRWRQVDLLAGVITVGRSKTDGGEGRLVPLSQTAWDVIKEWRSQFPGAIPGHAVFPRESYGLMGSKGTFGGKVEPYETFPDQPVLSFATAWRRAKKAAEIECRWHDLRHSCISRIAAGGATDGTIQAIAGWMSPKMIERYSHVRNAAKRQAVAVFDLVGSLE